MPCNAPTPYWPWMVTKSERGTGGAWPVSPLRALFVSGGTGGVDAPDFAGLGRVAPPKVLGVNAWLGPVSPLRVMCVMRDDSRALCHPKPEAPEAPEGSETDESGPEKPFEDSDNRPFIKKKIPTRCHCSSGPFARPLRVISNADPRSVYKQVRRQPEREVEMDGVGGLACFAAAVVALGPLWE